MPREGWLRRNFMLSLRFRVFFASRGVIRGRKGRGRGCQAGGGGSRILRAALYFRCGLDFPVQVHMISIPCLVEVLWDVRGSGRIFDRFGGVVRWQK